VKKKVQKVQTKALKMSQRCGSLVLSPTRSLRRRIILQTNL